MAITESEALAIAEEAARRALAALMCPRHESTRHALNQLRVENKHLRAEIERLQRERDALAAKVASYERADRDLNEALNMGDGSYRP